jgi:hypothetical protein
LAYRTNPDVFDEWARGIIWTGQCRRMRGGTVHVDENGVLWYERRRHPYRATWGPVELARYLPASKTILLNGDGFTDNSATNNQTDLRNTVRRLMAIAHPQVAERLAVIPFAALTAAGVRLDTLTPIDVVEDEMEIVYHKETLPELSEMKVTTKTDNREVREGTHKKQRFRHTTEAIKGWRHRVTGRTKSWLSYSDRRDEWDYMTIEWRPQAQPWELFRPEEDGRLQSWERLIHHTKADLDAARRQRDRNNARALGGQGGFIERGTIPTDNGMYWMENNHHLGACLFSAVSGDGKKHEFLSAFDEDEPNQMYYLAQLPDKSNAVTYQEAVLALAPPLVHQARLEKRRVRRQGDVFAIETTLTDEQVYQRAKTRVRRNVAMASTGTDLGRSFVKGEVVEYADCPGKCGHRIKTGNGEKAKRALMIYGTGHTATEVVVAEKGITYIRGTMHHDPGLQERGRRREHVDVQLGDKWHLALRNTVPRQQTRRDQPVVATA